MEKIKYWYYSRKYKKYFNTKFLKEYLSKLKDVKYIRLGRQNGKTVSFIKLSYVIAVEQHNFTAAKAIRKVFKEMYHINIF